MSAAGLYLHNSKYIVDSLACVLATTRTLPDRHIKVYFTFNDESECSINYQVALCVDSGEICINVETLVGTRMKPAKENATKVA